MRRADGPRRIEVFGVTRDVPRGAPQRFTRWLTPQRVRRWLAPLCIARWLSPLCIARWLTPLCIGRWLTPRCRTPRSLGIATACVGLLSGCIGTPTPLHPHLEGSVGFPHSGVQTQSVELPVSGRGFVRFRPGERVYWGQPQLVNAIVSVSGAVQQRFGGGPPLVLGDLSARSGGHIPRHNSHRSGRDVDVLWSLMTPEGQPVRSPGFIKMGPDGLAVDPGNGRYYRLDLERQWQVVRGFLLDDAAMVQWMFCATWIETMLIEYARALGEPDELVWRAQTVLLQPADSLPHDDHLHLRVACSPEQAVTGCSGGGPHWEWFPPLPVLSDVTTEELAAWASAEPPLQETENAATVATAPGR